MGQVRHSIEVVSDRLADAIGHEVDLLATFLRPPGQRPLFTTRVGLDWWRKHRADDLGRRVMENMRPDEIMGLDAALAEGIEAERLAPPLG